MAIGEAGSLSDNTTFTGEPIQVTFAEALDDPVIALTSTNYGGHKFALRVIEVQTDPGTGLATGFTFTIDEWENHDGAHPAVEDINWIAVEAGTHTLPDGRVIQAGYADADSDGETVALDAAFAAPPVVVSTVASDRFASTVTSEPSDVTADDFLLRVEEAESQDGVHGLERVGWIAIQTGGDATSGTASNADSVNHQWDTYGLGADFADPIVIASAQTQDGRDTGTVIFRNLDATDDEIDLQFEEDTTTGDDGFHVNEVVGVAAFERGLILCFTAGTRIDTPYGPRPMARGLWKRCNPAIGY